MQFAVTSITPHLTCGCHSQQFLLSRGELNLLFGEANTDAEGEVIQSTQQQYHQQSQL